MTLKCRERKIYRANDPNGKLDPATIVRSSGDADWDATALQAVQRSNPMPIDTNGKAPARFLITLRPN
ncbi:hypothetical protein BN2475_310160 [Paraburkholderia ribeironis]|uniref:TonB C-terminal domain-containing protein n=1 Tax=Paraburkholderia ribeironis TaxID=1247936 RepID=A0A1N7S2R8_9BURK|nr:hypothetical protein BN2475_310160 [Paraburkholderia ribeironis]